MWTTWTNLVVSLIIPATYSRFSKLGPLGPGKIKYSDIRHMRGCRILDQKLGPGKLDSRGVYLPAG